MKARIKVQHMLGTIFLTLVSKKKIQMSEDDTENRVITLLALLKTNEEKLIEDVKCIAKNSRSDALKVFHQRIDGWTLFHASVLRGCRKVVKIALKSGIDVNMEMGQPEGIPGGCSALHLAAHRGDVSIIDILLSNNANVNQTDNSGKTPMFYATRAHNTLAVKTLKRAGAVLNARDIEKISSVRSDEMSGLFCFLPFPGCTSSKTK